MSVICINRKKNMSRRGFSLPEVLISVGLMAFVATAAIGGLVVVNDVRDKIDKMNTAQMIMFATESYLRADLNSCTNPCDMDCSVYRGFETDEDKTFGPVFYIMDPNTGRYANFIICNSTDTKNVTQTTYVTLSSPKVQYWNSTSGICVGVNYASNSASYYGSSIKKERKYILAQTVMEGTGMYSLIGNGALEVGAKYTEGSLTEVIDYDEEKKMFVFWIYIIDKNDNNKVIMKHKVEVCPDSLMPTTIP